MESKWEIGSELKGNFTDRPATVVGRRATEGMVTVEYTDTGARQEMTEEVLGHAFALVPRPKAEARPFVIGDRVRDAIYNSKGTVQEVEDDDDFLVKWDDHKYPRWYIADNARFTLITPATPGGRPPLPEPSTEPPNRDWLTCPVCVEPMFPPDEHGAAGPIYYETHPEECPQCSAICRVVAVGGRAWVEELGEPEANPQRMPDFGGNEVGFPSMPEERVTAALVEPEPPPSPGDLVEWSSVSKVDGPHTEMEKSRGIVVSETDTGAKPQPGYLMVRRPRVRVKGKLLDTHTHVSAHLCTVVEKAGSR